MQIIKDWKSEIINHFFAVENFLEQSRELHNSYTERNRNRTEIGFNVFTIASDFYYRENFHSDIIKSFLDPNGKHNEGSKYLHLFIDLLNKKNNQIGINKEDFNNTIVERERHNIDILITDEYSKKAIIVENKINNAVDQHRQLPRYVNIVEKEFKIVAIVYLTLNSSKRPDDNDWTQTELEKINPILILISSYETDEKKPNLYNNWIIPSIINSVNNDSSCLLRQYGNLIKYLNTNTMDTVSLENFYNLLKENDNKETAISIRNMLNDLPEYLAVRIEDKYKEKCYPFKKIWRSKLRNNTVFDASEIPGLNLKLDILCDVDGYTARFWKPSDTNYDMIAEFKNKYNIFSEFNIHGDEKNSIKKHFKIFEEDKLFNFIDELIEVLKKIKENNK